MKMFDFALKLVRFLIIGCAAALIGDTIPGWTFERALLFFILWQVTCETRSDEAE